MKLVIVESPGKVKTIQHYLGSDFIVRASLGHVRDLPDHDLGIDIEHDYAETYQVLPDKTKTVEMLKKLARQAEIVYLATDPDREGEAIAWHLSQLLPRRDQKKVSRITFNQITEQAIQAAIRQPRDIRAPLVAAYRARRILDRLVGYEISPLLRESWQLQSRGKLSAGRVQSTALRILVERQRARRDFKPWTFWRVRAGFQTTQGVAFAARLANPDTLYTAEELDRLLDQLDSVSNWRVGDVSRSTISQEPQPPFTTSALQQEASKRLGFNPKQTDAAAQALYETGLITYLRTDAVQVAPEAQAAARALISAEYGLPYLPGQPPTYRARGGAQEAHESIRPTCPSLQPEQLPQDGLGADQIRLYTLIWRRFIASQMAPASFDVVEVHVTGDPAPNTPPLAFIARSRQRTFAGYQAVYEDILEGDDPNPDENVLPSLPAMTHNEALVCQNLAPEEHQTKPPQAFSQARLIGELERLGIGRPSTFAATVDVLLNRGYAEMKKKHIQPTPLGEQVHDLLVASFPSLFNVDFTAVMEKLLDHVAAGNTTHLEVVSAFYQGTLAPAVQAVRQNAPPSATSQPCPKCAQPLVTKTGKRGAFLSCSAWPRCDYTRELAEARQ